MKHAIVAVEDKRFYEHRGVDLRGMARAVWADVTHRGTVQGGSTITQQLVKNAYLTSQKTIARKLTEAALAWQLEQKWSKDRILTAYLNTVYFGNGAYGVEQASKVYFHHSALTLKPAEAALLAGIPEDPSAWDPVAHPQAAKSRRNLVLRLLYQQGYLTQSQYVNSLVFPMPEPGERALPSTQGKFAPYFANYVKDQLVNHYGPKVAFGGGLKVTTTLDTNLQKIAQDAIAKVLPQNGTNPAVALVAIDTQSDPGAVRAMVGGANYHKNQFNLATQGERQPGSSFKPFVLATALKENIAPSSILTSSKQVTINIGGRHLAGQQLRGRGARADQPLAGDRVLRQLGVLTADRDRRSEATSRRPRTSSGSRRSSTGTSRSGSAPSRRRRSRWLARTRSFADGGKRIDGSIFGNQPRAIETIRRRRQRSTSTSPSRTTSSRSDQAATVNQLLQGVVQYGTGKAAALPGWQVAGKTGTTEDYGDAWFVGYTPQLVVAVWVGYPDKLVPMTYQFHGHPVAGGTFPALIWKAFMEKALPYLKLQPESFTPPPSLYASAVTVVNRGGVLAARRRRLQEHVPARVLRRRAAADERQRRAGRDVQAERGGDPRRRRPLARVRANAPPGSAAHADDRLQAGEDRRPGRLRRRPVPAPRHCFGLRQDHADRGEVTARRRAARRRHARRAGEGEARAAASEGVGRRAATRAR